MLRDELVTGIRGKEMQWGLGGGSFVWLNVETSVILFRWVPPLMGRGTCKSNRGRGAPQNYNRTL